MKIVGEDAAEEATQTRRTGRDQSSEELWERALKESETACAGAQMSGEKLKWWQ